MAKSYTQRKIDGRTIENNVPYPEFKASSLQSVWPFSKMEIGESFGLEGREDVERCRASASAYSRRFGGKFSIRKTPDASTAYRCWRME